MKKHLLLLVAICATSLAFAAKIYVNPGHGTWGGNDRNMATVTHALGDTTGFYESNTNMWKCYYLREKLQKAGHTVVMSHTKCGYSPELKVVATEAQQSGADHFISVHSNAGPDGSNGSFANYPSYWYRGTTGNPYSAGTLDFAKAAWPHTFDIHDKGMEYNSSWSLTNPGFYADISFWGSSSTTTIDGVTYTGYYGVIRHGIPGYIVEGYFHTYEPARHRALNPDWCRQEGLRHYRGIAAKFGTPAETKGYIMGYIRTKEKTMNMTNYQYTKGNDQYMPINGARVYLTNAAGDTIMTNCYNYVARMLKNQKCYTTDNNYNGVFVYEDLTPGTYTITVRADGYKKYTETITVTADKTAYTQIFMTSGVDEEEEPTPTPDPTPDPGNDGTETDYASGMNPYAYGLYHEMNADSTQITLRWWLNAPATSVKIIFNDGEKDYVVRDYKNVAVDGYKDVINTSVLPRGKRLTWRVDVTGAGFKKATKVNKEYYFLRPTSVDVDDNPENASFGRMLCNEAYHEIKGLSGSGEAGAYSTYKSYSLGAGIYEFDAKFDFVKGHNGGNNFKVYREDLTDKKSNTPNRIRIADDGRVFVTSFNGGVNWGGKIMWELDAATLDTWSPMFQYSYINSTTSNLVTADGYFIAAPNIGFDVKGSGENLKLLMLSANANCYAYYNSAFRCYEYNWGKAKSWSTAPTRKIFDGDNNNNCNPTYKVINFYSSQVQYDKQGGVWVCQYRGEATDVNPSLVYYDKDGVYRYHELMNNRGGGGFRFNKDFTRVIISGGNGVWGEATVYTVSNDANGYPTKLTKEFTIPMNLGENIADYAWDYADNIYAVGYSANKVVAYALPHSNGRVVSTPAAGKYAFTLSDNGETPEPEPDDAEGMNPFAYALSSTLNADKTVLTVNYSLNAKASEVNVVVLAGETVLKTIACEGLTKGAHSVEVPTADFPTEEAITWRVDVKGAEVKEVTLVDNSVKMYAPTSVDIDNNPENENFGTVFVVEGLPTAKDNATYANYISYTDGAGLYVLNADGTAHRMPNQGDKVRYGYNGGRVSQTRQYFNGNSSSAYSPYRVRVSEDGRIFVSSLSPDGQVLWEADPLVFSRPDAADWQERAVAGWTHVMSDKNDNTVMATEKRNCTHTYCGIYGLFEGNAATGTFIAGPNIGFDVRGAGKDLKLLMLSGCKQAIVSFTPAHFYCDEYDLGEATMWNTAPSRRIFKGNVVNHVGTQVQYDEDGNVWMCQYRQGTDYPTLMKFNAASTDEVLYNEDPRQPYHRCGAIRFNNDYTQVAIATVGSGTGGAFTVYPVVDGMPVWNQGTEVDCKSVTHQSLMDFAWDYAGNLYIAADAASGTAGHCVAIYAMPHAADKVVSTPAAKKYAFSVECQSGATYTVKTICDPEEGGTISCQLGGNARVAGVLTNIPSCTELTVTATPDPGYQFLGWEDDLHNTVSTNPVYTFFVTRDITLKAKFKYATYNVTWWNLFKDGEDIVSNTHDSKRNARLWYLFMPYYNVDGSDKDRDIKPNVGDNKDEYNVLNFGYTATKDILLGTKMEWLGKYLSKVEGNLSNSNSYSDWRACLYPFINRVGYVRSADGTKITSGYWDINYENIKKFANGAADPKAWRPFWCQEACDLDSLIMFSDNMPIDWNQIVGPSQEYDTYTTTLPTSGIPTKTPKWYQWNTAPKANQLLAWREGGTDPMNNRIVHHVDKSMALYATYVDKKLQEDDPAPSGEHDASNDDVLRLLANPNYGSTEHNISVDRSLVGGMYNTICLPFDVYQNNLPAFLNGADIKKFSGVEQKYEESGDPVVVLNFVDVQPTADGILLEAGKPYLVNPKKDVPAASMIYQGVKWWNVLIDKGPYIETGGSSSVEFHGVFNPTSLRVGDYILVADSRLAKVTDTAEKLKGFRGYFKINDEELQSVAEEGRLYLSMKKPTTTSIPLAPEAEKPVQPKVRKVMHDGKIYILRGDEVYTVTGHRVR